MHNNFAPIDLRPRSFPVLPVLLVLCGIIIVALIFIMINMSDKHTKEIEKLTEESLSQNSVPLREEEKLIIEDALSDDDEFQGEEELQENGKLQEKAD